MSLRCKSSEIFPVLRLESPPCMFMYVFRLDLSEGALETRLWRLCPIESCPVINRQHKSGLTASPVSTRALMLHFAVTHTPRRLSRFFSKPVIPAIMAHSMVDAATATSPSPQVGLMRCLRCSPGLASHPRWRTRTPLRTPFGCRVVNHFSSARSSALSNASMSQCLHAGWLSWESLPSTSLTQCSRLQVGGP